MRHEIASKLPTFFRRWTAREWLIHRLGGAVFATRHHRYSVETRHREYYADRVVVSPSGTIEWWVSDPEFGSIHRTLIGGEAEIVDHEATTGAGGK